MLEFVTALWLGIIGGCIGSFLNVVAYRMPRGMSVVWKPSHCPACGHAIRPRDNVPVLGWLLLRGRCRDCGMRISPRYAVVEAIMAATFFILAYVELFTGAANLPGGPLTEATGAWKVVWTPNWEIITLYAYHVTLLSLLMAMALIDQDGQPIPRSLVLLTLVVIAAGSYNWWHAYPERTRTIRIREWKAQLDALLGIAWGAAPWAAVALVLHRRGKPGAGQMLTRIAIGLGTVGGFLGLRGVVRAAILWLPIALISRAVARRRGQPLGFLPPLWLATFLQIIFWKQVAAVLSW